jgi:acyl carrier protein
MEDTLRHFIQTNLLHGKTSQPITAEDNLLAHGMIDSLGIVQLLAFIEKDFGVKVPPEDVTIQHFRTVKTIVEYLKHHSS